MKRENKTPQTPKADPAGPFADAIARDARIRDKTVHDLADMVRRIVASRGKGENRLAFTDHPLKPALLDAFQLACRLDPCRKTTIEVGVNKWGGQSAVAKTRHIEPSDPVTGLKSNALNRLACVLLNVMERIRRGEADGGEHADLMAIADVLDGGKPEGKDGPEGTKPSIKDRFAFNPGQALFDGKDLGLSAGLPVETLKNLVSQFGNTVAYKVLQDDSTDKAASEQLRTAASQIRKVLKTHHVPCRIESKTRNGYCILPA